MTWPSRGTTLTWARGMRWLRCSSRTHAKGGGYLMEGIIGIVVVVVIVLFVLGYFRRGSIRS